MAGSSAAASNGNGGSLNMENASSDRIVFQQRFGGWDGPELACDALHHPVARLGALRPFQRFDDSRILQHEVAQHHIGAFDVGASASWRVRAFEYVAAHDGAVAGAVSDDVV